MKAKLHMLMLALAGCPAIAPLPADFARADTTPSRVALGRKLFSEPALSSNGQVSCATCHDLAQFGVDHRATSIGVAGTPVRRNAPSVFNAAGQVAQFWDGRAADVEAQALGPLFAANEMGHANEEAVRTALEVSGYLPSFQENFPGESEPLNSHNVARAIGAFERTLVTPAPIDRYLAGDRSALTSEQRAGFDLFNNLGCVNCHSGPLVGGERFRRLGAQLPWPDRSDLGRSDVTHSANDELVFKVPSLRNVAETAPYFHNGSVGTLREAVQLMGRHQLGAELPDTEGELLVEFLKSLTGIPNGEDR